MAWEEKKHRYKSKYLRGEHKTVKKHHCILLSKLTVKRFNVRQSAGSFKSNNTCVDMEAVINCLKLIALLAYS